MENFETSQEAKEMEVNFDESKITIIRPYTEEQIDNHAAKCGGRRNLREIPIDTDSQERFVYLVKKPSRAVMQAIAAEENKKEKQNITTVQQLMLGCVLEGDKEAYDYDGAIYLQLIKNIGGLVRTAKGDIKKI